MALNLMTSVPISDTQRRNTGTTGKGHLKTDAEGEVLQPQARGHLKPPETRRDKEGYSFEPSAGAQSCRHLDLVLIAFKIVRY